MKTCKFFELLLSRSLDNDLNIKEQKKLQAHLSSCAGCREKAKLYLSLRSAFGNKESAQETLLHTICRQALSESFKPKGRLLWFRQPLNYSLRYSAGVAVLLAVVWIFFNSNKLEQETISQNNKANYMLSVDYPMAGILTYEEGNADEANILDSYAEVYTPRLNSYFNYVGFEK